MIGDNSDVDASDSDVDFSHAITESDDNFDLEDEEPLFKHVPSALKNTSADASNASNAVDFDWEDEEPLSKHASSSSNTSADASTTVKSGKKNARKYRWRAKNIKDLNKNTVFIDEDFPPMMTLNFPLLWVISRCSSMRICLTTPFYKQTYTAHNAT